MYAKKKEYWNRKPFFTLLLTVCGALACLGGCGQKPQSVVVRVAITLPGTNIDQVEKIARTQIRGVLTAAKAPRLRVFITPDGAEVFAISALGADRQDFAEAVDRAIAAIEPQLPVGAKAGMGQIVPVLPTLADYPVNQTPVRRVELDHNKVAALGISPEAIAAAIQAMKESDPANTEVPVKTANGSAVPLSSIGHIMTTYQDSHRMLEWP